MFSASGLEVWNKNIQVLKSIGYEEELIKIVKEMFVLKQLVGNLTTDDECEHAGIGCLIETISTKISDLSQGRVGYMLLPTE